MLSQGFLDASVAIPSEQEHMQNRLEHSHRA